MQCPLWVIRYRRISHQRQLMSASLRKRPFKAWVRIYAKCQKQTLRFLFGLKRPQTKEVEILFRCTRRAKIARVVIGPGQRHGKHGEHQNDPGKDDDSFCRHG
jgi:hypothetical protein